MVLSTLASHVVMPTKQHLPPTHMHVHEIEVYVDGTLLYPSISLLEIGKDTMPTPHGWERNYAYL